MGLLDLPNELLLAIKAHIDPADLLTHACYHQLCERTEACYDDSAAEPGFWRALVRANGLGLHALEGDSERTWVRVGVQCAEHAWTCREGACGVARLEDNRKLMQDTAKEWSEWDFGRAVSPEESYAAWRRCIAANPLLGRLSFNSNFPVPFHAESELSRQVAKCAFIRQQNLSGWSHDDLLASHPIALRSFATFPFLTHFKTLSFDNEDFGSYRLQAENEHGITVHDYLITLSKILGKRMSCDQLDEFMDWANNMPKDREDIFPSTWGHRDVLKAASRVGSWFQLMNWTGITTGSRIREGGPYFMTWFEYKELAEDAREHLATYKFARRCTVVDDVPVP
ncbi:hypothetical protein PsYK624_162070 [Phanerochaete sordida]|uniref:F-box domain-containing protein n=1 Tax=Phanerochaete sordida TaxID=48140 RepID=A0A9P3GSC8_9APHY|nr:hypothetical protein PsYK624_162070 [Phanerochaete sordida]